MKRLPAALMVMAWVLFGIPHAIEAQTTAASVTYASGWNLVGAPPGTSYSSADALYSWMNNAYSSPSSPLASICQGYWAHFTIPTTVTLSTSIAGLTHDCALQEGWNLVGNPFAGGAVLPSDVVAYFWNPSTSRYDIVKSIPPGGAVWIQSESRRTLLLQLDVTSNPPPSTITISDLLSGPYRVHVGDTVKLLLPSPTPSTVSVSPPLLQLQSAGFLGSLSCVGDPTCSLSFVTQYWTWQATGAGTAYITLTPTCTQSKPACQGATQRIEVDILP